VLWAAVAGSGAVALGVVALVRGEPINVAWLLVAAVATYVVAYRFYSKFLAARVLMLDDLRQTPAERINDGRDFVPTNRWVVFGHHFAAIAGPGPLIGPTLCAQFGYLPGTLWIIVGVVLGGAVQDFLILTGSLRRDGKSLGQMARDEIGVLGGFAALAGVLMKQGRVAEGLEHLETAVRLAPANPQLHEQLGQAYQGLGQTTEAEQQFAAARRLLEKGQERRP